MKKLLSNKVIDKIRTMIANVIAHPETYNQNNFPTDVSHFTSEFGKGAYTAGTTCGTEFCAAGHIIYARSPKDFLKRAAAADDYDWEALAVKELGKKYAEYLKVLTESDEYINTHPVYSIFGTAGDWPERYRILYRKAEKLKTKKGRQNGKAKAFAARWEGFIASDGRDVEKYYYPEEREALES